MTQDEILGIIRHLLTALGGVLVTKGYVDGAGLDTIVGALVAVAGVAWSVYQKRQAAKALAASAPEQPAA